MSFKRVINEVYAKDFNMIEFLQTYYHRMTRIIEPRHFFSYLRSRNVLSLDDQEYVMKSYHTTYMQAGSLIDTISKKGHPGFVAFMEVIEYNYPILYSDITNIEPRQPPQDFNPIRRDLPVRYQQSADILELMGRITNQLTSEVADKRNQLAQLQMLVDRMKEALSIEEDRNNSISNELGLTNEKLRLVQLELDQLTLDHVNLQEQHAKDKNKCEQLISKTINFDEQCNEWKLKCQTIGLEEIQKTSELEKLKLGNKSLRKQLINLQSSQLPCPDDLDSDGNNNSGSIRRKQIEMQEKNNQLQNEIVEMAQEKMDLLLKLSRLEEIITETKKSYEDLLLDKTQMSQRCLSIEEKLHNETARNEKLKVEMNQYLESYRNMALEIDTLNKELQETRKHNNEFYLNLKKPHKLGLDSCSSSQKRHGSLTRFYSPLIIFSPKEIEDLILEECKKHFDPCPIVIIPSNELDRQIKNLDILYYTNTSNGYECITISHLQQVQSTVLLIVPETRISCLTRNSIKPIVAIIKIDEINNILEFTKAEEILEGENLAYEVILLDKAIRSNAEEILEIVLPKLKKMVEENQP